VREEQERKSSAQKKKKQIGITHTWEAIGRGRQPAGQVEAKQLGLQVTGYLVIADLVGSTRYARHLGTTTGSA
jgi:hypothetical protein